MAEETVKIEADLSKLLVGDLVILTKANNGDLPMEEQIALLDRVIVGGASRLPLTEWRHAVSELWKAVTAAMNPAPAESPEKN